MLFITCLCCHGVQELKVFLFPHPFCQRKSTCLDRTKKKIKSLKIENFNQTRRCPLFRGLTVLLYWNQIPLLHVVTLLTTQSHRLQIIRKLNNLLFYSNIAKKDKNCGKQEVFEITKYSIHNAVTRETNDELTNKLIHSKLVKLNTIW